MVSNVYSIALMGIDGYVVEIETEIQNGLPGINMVGLPDIIIKESKERVHSAIKNSQYKFPLGKIIVNFAPADIKKEGTHFDLAIAIGILVSNQDIKNSYINDCIFIGELSLNGGIRSVRGILPMVIEATKCGYKNIFIPEGNKNEIYIHKEDINIYAVSNLKEVCDFLNNEYTLDKIDIKNNYSTNDKKFDVDFNEVKGQKLAKRAIEIAVSGGHNILMIGPPGGGKTMLSQRIPTIIPDLTFDESIEVTKIYSISGLLGEKNKIITCPPFRSPHHSVSTASFIGGGTNPGPGEVSLSHNGVLFLDELPEYRRDTLEALRQPMEDGKVCISRVNGKYTFPSRFMFVGSMNPCPCGYYGYQLKECKCSAMQIKNYLNRISGPLLDRIDIHISVEPVTFNDINSNINEEQSSEIKERVKKVRKIQYERFKNDGILYNAQMRTKQIKKYCKINKDGMMLLENAFINLSMSTRAYTKIIKIARTIADMEANDDISENNIAEAIQYRVLDRKYW